jgi:hypothetical protein
MGCGGRNGIVHAIEADMPEPNSGVKLGPTRKPPKLAASFIFEAVAG